MSTYKILCIPVRFSCLAFCVFLFCTDMPEQSLRYVIKTISMFQHNIVCVCGSVFGRVQTCIVCSCVLATISIIFNPIQHHLFPTSSYSNPTETISCPHSVHSHSHSHTRITANRHIVWFDLCSHLNCTNCSNTIALIIAFAILGSMICKTFIQHSRNASTKFTWQNSLSSIFP